MSPMKRLIAGLFAVALVATACGGDSDGEVTATAGGTDEAADAVEREGFVGLAFDEAVSIAESENRPWRLGKPRRLRCSF